MFLEADFAADSATVLTASRLCAPSHLNDHVQIRRLVGDQDWKDALKIQTICAEPMLMNDDYKRFKRRQFATFPKMSRAKKGSWFGAFINGKLEADLGIFYEGNIGRYQNVETHPSFRRQGICQTRWRQRL